MDPSSHAAREIAAPQRPLVAFWRACAPAGWTLTAAEGSPGRGRVRLHDPEGRAHELTWEPAAPGTKALLRGRRLAFAYRPPDTGTPPVDAYRATLHAAAAREDELAELAEALPARVEEPPPVFIGESALWLALARELGAAPSIAAAAERWLARAARPGELRDLILYFEAPCRQACEFCEEPQRRAEPIHRAAQQLVQIRQRTPLDLVASGAFAALLGALARREDAPRLTLMGHDWLEHPRLDEVLAAIERQPGLRLRCYGPSTRLADPALAARVARLPGLESVGLTLQSCDPAIHDAIVGAPGAGARVQEAIDELRRVGAPVQLTLVLSRRALPSLAETVHWAAARGLRITLQAFVPDRGLRGAGAVLARADAIAEALAKIDAAARAFVDCLVGVPWCAAPEPLRDRLRPSVAGSRSEPLLHPAACAGCAVRARCPGVPASYVTEVGNLGLAPWSAAGAR